MGPPMKIAKMLYFFTFFWPTQKMGPDGPKWGQADFFLLIQTLPTFWGRTNFDFENFYFFDFFGSQISRFPGPRFANFQKSGLGLGPSRAQPKPGPSLGPMGPSQAQVGSQKIPKIKIIEIKIRSAKNVGKVWMSRKKTSWPHLGPSG